MHIIKRGYYVLSGTIFFIGGVGVPFQLTYPGEWYVVPFAFIAAGIGIFVLVIGLAGDEDVLNK